MIRYHNRACACKKAAHQHGTRVCYIVDKCRCKLCTVAATSASRLSRLEAMYVSWGHGETPYVDASDAVTHIRALQAAGVGWKEVATRAGLSSSVISALLYGRPDRNQGQPRARCRPATRDAILAVPIPTPDQLAPGALVDANPTYNRVRALAVMGYPVSEVARQAEIDPQRLYRLMAGGGRVTAKVHNRVREVYSRLWSTPWQPTTPAKRDAARRARDNAMSRGWPSPLDIDSDGTLAVHDHVAEARDSVASAPATQSRQLMVLDDWAELVRGGELPERAAKRLGVTQATVERYAYRFNHARVIALLGQVAA